MREAAAGGRRYVLLDRDGTIMVDKGYLADPAGVALLPGARDGLRRLAGLGLGLVILTNQSGIGRGYFTAAAADAVNDRLVALLAADGIAIASVHVCPHTPDAGCLCRKPRPGLAEAAARRHGFNPAAAFVIGDKASDLGLGRAIGATSVLVRTGYGRDEDATGADLVADDLAAAAAAIEARLTTR